MPVPCGPHQRHDRHTSPRCPACRRCRVDFSNVCWFFGRDLFTKRQCPAAYVWRMASDRQLHLLRHTRAPTGACGKCGTCGERPAIRNFTLPFGGMHHGRSDPAAPDRPHRLVRWRHARRSLELARRAQEVPAPEARQRRNRAQHNPGRSKRTKFCSLERHDKPSDTVDDQRGRVVIVTEGAATLGSDGQFS